MQIQDSFYILRYLWKIFTCMNTIQAFQIFEKSIAKYHVLDSVDQAF